MRISLLNSTRKNEITQTMVKYVFDAHAFSCHDYFYSKSCLFPDFDFIEKYKISKRQLHCYWAVIIKEAPAIYCKLQMHTVIMVCCNCSKQLLQ